MCLVDKDEPVKPCSKQKSSEAQLIAIADTEHMTVSMLFMKESVFLFVDLWGMSLCSKTS